MIHHATSLHPSSYTPGTGSAPTRSGSMVGKLHSRTAGCYTLQPAETPGNDIKNTPFPSLRNVLQQSDLLRVQEHLPNRKGCQKLQLQVKTIVSTYCRHQDVIWPRPPTWQGARRKDPSSPNTQPTDVCRLSKQTNWCRPQLPISAAGITKKSLCRWDTFRLLWGAGGASLPKRRRRRKVRASVWAPALCYSWGHRAATPLLPACSLRCQLVSSDLHPKCQEK